MRQLFTSPRLRLWIVRLVPVVFYALLLIFLVLYLRKLDIAKLEDLQPNWWYLVLAAGLAMSTRYLGAFTWLVILRTLGAADVRLNRTLIYVYAKAWLGRYIPGTAPWILGKIFFASQHGISKQKLAVGSLLEAGIQIVTLLVFSLALLSFDSRLDVLGSGFKLLMLVVAICGITVLIPVVFNRLIDFAFRLLRRGKLGAEHGASPRTILRGSSLYLLSAIINGFVLFCIAKAIDPSLALHNAVFAIGIASLSGAASMLALFAPSGVGVREGIQLVLLVLVMPKELALATTVIMRLWDVGIDTMFFAISRLFMGLHDAKSTNDSQRIPGPETR